MVKTKEKSKKSIEKNPLYLFMILGVTICATLALSWMISREFYLAATKSTQENRQNVVVNTVGAPSDLVRALLAEDSGCIRSKNTDYIVRQSGNFALVHYGCSLDAYAFYEKQNGTWVGLNPTNNFINGVPLCSHLKEHSIPASFQATCYNGNPSQAGILPLLVVNSVE